MSFEVVAIVLAVVVARELIADGRVTWMEGVLLLATYVIETIGTQEYELAQVHFLERMAKAYGDDAAAEVEPHVSCPRP